MIIRRRSRRFPQIPGDPRRLSTARVAHRAFVQCRGKAGRAAPERGVWLTHPRVRGRCPARARP
ncbi:hypothetical protein BURPS406E_B0747 [Burkholderia pseudomallei 406e]|nr:hypothetical protein BURPS406E_B0747 [Burkholderia pseudomallei 406e]